DAVQAEVVQVVAGTVAVGAVLAVPGDRAVDESGVGLAENVIADAEAIEHARAEALHQHVGRLRQFQQSFFSWFLLQVEPDRALVAVEAEVDRRAGAERRGLLGPVVRRGPAAGGGPAGGLPPRYHRPAV